LLLKKGINMMEFTLSKFNMLIFVTAIVAIVLFFMTTVNDNLKNRQSFELVYRVDKEVKSGIDSRSYCSIKYIELPTRITTNESTSSTFNLNYVLNVSSYSMSSIPDANYDNKLIFSIMDRKQSKIYAASDVDFNGILHLYNWEYNNGEYNFDEIIDSEGPISTSYDPLRERSIDNSLVFIKKIKQGVPHYYLLPCATKYGIRQCQAFACSVLKESESVDCISIVPDLNCS